MLLPFHPPQSAAPAGKAQFLALDPLLHANLQSAQVFRSDVLNPPPPPLNTNDSAIASDHLPVQIVFNHPYVQPFRITSLVRSNQSVTLTWESVPGQSYTVESTATLGATNAWTVLAQNIFTTNYLLTLQANLGVEAPFFRLKRSD